MPSTVTSVADSGPGSLRAAIATATPGDTINFNFAPSTTPQTITLTSGELVLNKNLTIQGLGAGQLTISGGGHSRVFEVDGAATNVTLSGLTITRGIGTNPSTNVGGGVYNNAATVTIVGSTLSVNSANYGGGVYNSFGTLSIVNSTLSGNHAGSSGGGVYNNLGTLSIAGSTLSGNFANYGAGVYNIGNPANSTIGRVTISTSTLSGNTASYGGGLYNSSGNVTVSTSTLSGNTASEGSGVYTSFTLPNSTQNRVTITDCTFSREHLSDIRNVSSVALVTVSGSTFSVNSTQAFWGLWVNDGGNHFGF